MGGYVPHPRIDDALGALGFTRPVADIASARRTAIGLAYLALSWDFLHELLPPHEMAELRDRVDELIRADAQQLKGKTE